MPESEDISDVGESSSHTVIDQSPSAAEKPNAKKRGYLRLGLVALVVLLLGGGGIWLAPFVQEALPGLLPQAATQLPDPRIGERVSQIEQLNARLALLEISVAQAGKEDDADSAPLIAPIDASEARSAPSAAGEPSDQTFKNLIARLDSLEGHLEKIDKDAADHQRDANAIRGQLRKQLERLNKRLERLKDAPETGRVFVGAAFFVAVGELRRQIDLGAPYRRELSRLESLTRQGRAVDPMTASYLSTLSKYADSGVATFALLEESYAAVVDAVIEGPTLGETGIWQRAWQSIAGVIKIRRIGEIEGDAPEAIVSRAEARLDEGDAAGAVEEMAGLSQPSDAVAAWIEAAVAHLQTRHALSALERLGFWGDAAS